MKESPDGHLSTVNNNPVIVTQKLKKKETNKLFLAIDQPKKLNTRRDSTE